MHTTFLRMIEEEKVPYMQSVQTMHQGRSNRSVDPLQHHRLMSIACLQTTSTVVYKEAATQPGHGLR